METPKHTPGPWEAKQSRGNNIYQHRVILPNIKTICEMEADGLKDLEEVKSNAKLIAAAPDLAECLAGLLYLGERMEEESGEIDPFVQKCRDTLIKAGINP